MKAYNLQIPESLNVHTMSESEMAQFASDHADQLLNAMPTGVKPIGVNRVSMLLPTDIASDKLEWTRSCCNARARIENFVEPRLEDFGIPETLGGIAQPDIHVESQLRKIKFQGMDHVAAMSKLK